MESELTTAESELCQSLGDLQTSVGALADIELEEVALEELQQSADAISSDVDTAQAAAEDELRGSSRRPRLRCRHWADDLETASAEGELTADWLSQLGADVSSSVTAFETVQDAASDCDLSALRHLDGDASPGS